MKKNQPFIRNEILLFFVISSVFICYVQVQANNIINSENFLESSMDLNLKTANELFNKYMWDEAINYYNEILKVCPNCLNVESNLQKAMAEQANKILLKEGLSLLSKGNYSKGIEKLDTISKSSVYYNEALIEIKIAQAHCKQKKNTEKNELKKQIEKTLQYYKKGNLDTAINQLLLLKQNNIDLLDSQLELGLSQLIEDMTKVQYLSDQGEREYKNKKLNVASSLWKELLQTEEKIIGKASSFYSNRIYIHIATEFCRKAQLLIQSGDYVQANNLCDKALNVKPNFKEALLIKKNISGKISNTTNVSNLPKEIKDPNEFINLIINSD
ncbi:MAG: hypothetical protein HQK67_08675 [Desulfamplus sp.]|nr:hypothetical protein [Desulfamplus sp.]